MARRTYDQYCPLAISLDVIGARWAPLVIRAVLRLGPHDRLEVGLVVGGEEFAAHARAGSMRVERGRHESPELVLRGEPAALVAAVTGEDSRPADVEFEGDAAALDRLRSCVA